MDAQELTNLTKLGDLPVEKKEQIKDRIIYGLEHEAELTNFGFKINLDANKTSYSWRKHYLPKIDKTSTMYRNGLLEGVTPDPEQYSVSEYHATVKPYGWWIGFTDEIKNHSFDDVVADFGNDLSNIVVSFHDEKKADAMLTTKNVVTGFDIGDKIDLVRAKSYLSKYATPVDGYFNCLVPIEAEAYLFKKYAEDFKYSAQHDKILETGYIGTVGGIKFKSSALKAFAPTVANNKTTFPFVIWGKSKLLKKDPVGYLGYDKQMEVISKGLGELGNDPLNQRGSVGVKLDGQSYFVADDLAIIRGEMEITDAGEVKALTFPSAITDENVEDQYTAGEELVPDKAVKRVGKTVTPAPAQENNG